MTHTTIRRLTGADLPALRDHLLRLDPATRRSRFQGAVSDAYLHAYAEAALAAQGGTFGHVVDGAVRGTAELRPVDDDEAEAAFTVEAPFRRQGVGTTLFRRLLLYARNRHIRVLHVRCLPENRAMQALARKHGARLIFDGEDTLGRLDAGLATPFSLLQEAVEEGFDLAAAMLETSRRFAAAARAGRS